MKLENVSDEFLDWLDQCPVQWFLVEQTNETLTYQVFKQDLKILIRMVKKMMNKELAKQILRNVPYYSSKYVKEAEEVLNETKNNNRN